MLTNMFDPSQENEPDWELDIRDDVLEKVMEFGEVVHIHVDVNTQVLQLVFAVQCWCNSVS